VLNKFYILNGKKLSNKIYKNLYSYIKNIKSQGIITPVLCIISVGYKEDQLLYIKNKKYIALNIGINILHYHFNDQYTEVNLINFIQYLNLNNQIDGIIIQLPLPYHISATNISLSIFYNKDVDGLHPLNLGYLLSKKYNFIPCTPLGCIYLLYKNKINIFSKNIVIIGKSNIVGIPLLHLLVQKDATVMLTHKYTKQLNEKTKKSEIIIACIGQKKFINIEYIRKNETVIIDIGINYQSNKNIIGDVNFNSVKKYIKKITPVPGGIGPLTVSMLLYNTILAYIKKFKI